MGQPTQELSREIPAIVEWLRGHVRGAGSKGCVVGLSGGIDSSVVGALCQRAFPENTLGLIMPFSECDEDFTDRAHELASTLGVQTVVHPIGGAHDRLLANFLKQDMGAGASKEELQVPLGNLRSRLRMSVLYLYGNSLNYFVVGTGNRDEDFGIGYFTKYGDGGVDLSPIADFHKSEVFQLGHALGVPRRILEAPPSAGLWDGQTDEGELGMTYDEIEGASQLLDGESDKLSDPTSLTPREIEVMAKVALLRHRNRHKLETPPIYRRRPGS